ncbi:MAG: penicillin acylase family protein [Bryobacteraceae bacterium]|jgi:penicillin amidase
MSPSPLKRIVRIVNLAVAVAVVAALAVVYWCVWRPLPRRSGSIEARVSAPVSVQFDAHGVPHIEASSLEDALFVQGYVTAQDRLWQMDALRRLAAGDLSEVVGAAALESDRESRRLRMRRIAESTYVDLPAPDRAAMAAYARGVNAFVGSHLDNLPLEFRLLAYQPRPWSVVDSLLVCLQMFRTLSTSWRDDLLKREMLAHGDAHKVDFLFPARSSGSPPPGSNGWALSGAHTASGKPLLANDMHLEYGLPGVWYMTHLRAPGIDVSGVALPGVPGIIVGHNQRIAWGITNLGFDVQDLYIEKLDPRTGRYFYRGQPEQARLEREIIRVKNQAAEEMLVWVTRHGPLLVNDKDAPMALRWVAAEPGFVQYPFLDIDRAQSWAEFRAALERLPGPASNFVYADTDGNIGYQVAGRLPIRRGYAGDVPLDGTSGDFEWDGFIPFADLPTAFNPPGGIIATANQDPFPAGYPYPVGGRFAPPYRANQVRARLQSRQRWRAEDMLGVQCDVYSAFGKFLAGQLVAAYDNRHARVTNLEDVISMLRAWNGQMEIRGGAPFLVALAFTHVRTALAENAAPGAAGQYDFPMSYLVVERLLRERPAGWFADYDEMLLTALVDAVEEGERIQGRDHTRWQYGAYSRMFVPNPVIRRIPWIGKYFNIGPVPMSGSPVSVKQVTARLAPSMRMDADLADWDRSLLNETIGQSGQVLSSHYRDQWDDYYAGRSFPMQFRKIDAASTLKFRPAR